MDTSALTEDQIAEIKDLNARARALDQGALALRTRRNALVGLPAPDDYEGLAQALGVVVGSLDDASSVVDAGDDENMAYEHELHLGRQAVNAARGDNDLYKRDEEDYAEHAKHGGGEEEDGSEAQAEMREAP